MKSSSHNQFEGTVKAVHLGPVSAELSIALKGGGEIAAVITSGAAERLKLQKGKEALVLIPANAIVLVADFGPWQLSARNQLAGEVVRIDRGAEGSRVVLALPGGAELAALVGDDVVAAMGLAVGTPATAVFKAYSVMVAAQR